MKIQNINGREFCCAKCGSQEVEHTGNPEQVECSGCKARIHAKDAIALGEVIPVKNYTSKVSPTHGVMDHLGVITKCPICQVSDFEILNDRVIQCRKCARFLEKADQGYFQRYVPSKLTVKCPRCGSDDNSFDPRDRKFYCLTCETFFTEQAAMNTNFSGGSLESMVNPTNTRKKLLELLKED